MNLFEDFRYVDIAIEIIRNIIITNIEKDSRILPKKV